MLKTITFSIFTFLCFNSFVHHTSITTPFITSILKDGDLYKITTTATGVFKLDYNFLKNDLGVSNIDNKDPKLFQLFSFGGNMLPELVSTEFDKGLIEHTILINGESDGKFDANDFILFYSTGPDKTYYSTQDQMHLVENNLYSRTASYILKIGNTPGKRIKKIPNTELNGTQKINSYIKVQHFEKEEVNLLSGRTVTYGSGKEWYGDKFETIRKKDYTPNFDLQGILPNSISPYKIAFAARSNEFTEAFFSIDQQTQKIQLSHTNTSDVEDDFARESAITNSAIINPNSKIIFDYPITGSPSSGWLNYITLNSNHELKWSDKPIKFVSPINRQKDLEYSIENTIKPIEVWNVTDPFEQWLQETKTTNTRTSFHRSFEIGSESFIAFDKAGSLPIPKSGGKVANQDLTSIAGIEAIVLYHKDFEAGAQKLASHRSKFSNIKTIPIPLDQVYNEFSAGQQDPTAIRNFARRLKLNNSEFNYLILLGDGSYDYLNLGSSDKPENFIPVYETEESLNPIYAFPSDDYFALLDPGEGSTALFGDLDIAIGRIPVRTKEETDNLINKIIDYDLKANEGSEDWKLRIGFSSDDEDSNIHLDQSEQVSDYVNTKYPVYNIQKIYLDAFKQTTGAGGEEILGAKQSLFDEIYQGLLVFNYLGHGGPKGLSQEGLLRISDVESYANQSKLPLIITATCSFAPYDDPNVNSAGEALFRSSYGGAIALFTTVRNVYSSSNLALTASVFASLFEKDNNGKSLPLGEILKIGKNSITSLSHDRANARKFALLGDPTQRLAIPSYKVKTTHIQKKEVLSNVVDTFKSLQPVSIAGEITDANGNAIKNYNGTVFITLFDKQSVIKTLGQNNSSFPVAFNVQNSILYKGSAPVTNGVFTIDFVIPKDIDYKYGFGKISYFATNNSNVDADGAYENIIIGGSVINIVDDTPPQIKAYINQFSFKNGDASHPNPLLLVSLFDKNGVNATGNSIGHDLIATIDGKNQYVLNNFYEALQGNFQKGIVRFPIKGLLPGIHHIVVKAWDVANNSATDSIFFEVLADNAPIKILSASVYPNPSATNEIKLSFTHNVKVTGNHKVVFALYTMDGKKLYEKEEVLSPAAVNTGSVNIPNSIPSPSTLLVNIEIYLGDKRLDSKGIKLLRIH